MPLVRANRDKIDDRFSVLGFTVRTESPLFEVGVATDPALFRTDHRAQRNHSNFFSSRAFGALQAQRGEAVYLVPPDVLAGFVGQPRLYFGLATYREASGGVPDFVQAPTEGHMYVDMSGLTERGLRRLARGPGQASYGTNNGKDPSLDWGGDAQPQAAVPASAPAAPAPSAGKAAAAGNPADHPYDDGFGAFPAPAATPAAKPAPAPAAVPVPGAAAKPAAQSLARLAYGQEDEDDSAGIEGPIPDDDAETQGVQLLGSPTPEYPAASRWAPAHPSNYTECRDDRRVERIVIHITDGTTTDGAVRFFQNGHQRMHGRPVNVSAHYIVGQDGEVVQTVRNNDIALHTHSANKHSIGIEHVANVHGLRPTDAQYRASAALAAWLCSKYRLPADRQYIVGHTEADAATHHHGCPGAVWDWDLYMGYVSAVAPVPESQGLAYNAPRRPYARAQEIVAPFYDPADPASALTCQANAFSQAREEWFAGVPNTTIFPHSAICLLEMKNGAGATTGFGTGFYIGANRILTCAHNLAAAASVDVVPGCNDTSEPYGRFNVASASWRLPASYHGGGDFDLAVIDNVPVAAPNGRWFDCLEELNQSRPEGVVVCGYSRKSDRVPELTQAMNGRTQHLHAGYIAQLRGEVFDYPILTLHRASGSPVYYLSERSGVMTACVVGVHISGELAATQDLNTGCRLTQAKIDWIEGRAATLALDSCFSIHWDTVPYIAQQTDSSCWAAAAAMVVAWRDGTSISDADIAAKVPALDAYRHGLWPSDRHLLADVWGLMPEPPASYTIEAWRDMLQTYGPLWLDMTNSLATDGHAWVLVGMTSDGAADGSDTVMYLHNPSASRGKVKWKYLDFLRLYEGRVGTEGRTLECQILHAEAVPAGLRPVTAAPFSLGLAADLRPGERRTARPSRPARILSSNDSDYAVPLIPQPDKNSCWAASMAMLLSFRRAASFAPESLVAEVGESLRTSYNWELLDAVRNRYGFAAIEVPSNTSLYFSAAQWAQWLADHGPLWVVIVGMPHAVVVAGLHGDTGNPAACTVKVLNPWDTRVAFDADPVDFHPANQGYESWMPFDQFASDFGNMAAPDYGNWRVLHLPAQAGAHAMSIASKQAKPASSAGRGLPPPPRPVRAMALGASPLDEPIEPSRVPGASMYRVRGSRGRVSWALDQLDGVKQADPAPAMVPAMTPTTISLDQWPCIAQDRVPLPLTVRFDAGGGAVGNVRVSAGDAADLPYDVTVTATIEDEQAQTGRSAPAAIRVTLDVDFSGTAQGNVSARTRLRLLGSGGYDLDSHWQ